VNHCWMIEWGEEEEERRGTREGRDRGRW